MEPHTVPNEAARELNQYLKELPFRIDPTVFRELKALAGRHLQVTLMVEKAVDVHIAVDMVAIAERDEYDAAYLLSADGDFTPAVEAVRFLNKKVYAATPRFGAQLATVVNSYIRLEYDWFSDCYRR